MRASVEGDVNLNLLSGSMTEKELPEHTGGEEAHHETE